MKLKASKMIEDLTNNIIMQTEQTHMFNQSRESMYASSTPSDLIQFDSVQNLLKSFETSKSSNIVNLSTIKNSLP